MQLYLVDTRCFLKNQNIQFQGKIQDPLKEDRYLSLFARISDEEDEDINQHMLPSPFDEETYSGSMVILASLNDKDDYDKLASEYTDLKVSEYETLYNEWSFNNIDEVEEIDEENEEEVESIVIEEDIPKLVKTIKPLIIQTKDVFIQCPIRSKIIENFKNILASPFHLSLCHSIPSIFETSRMLGNNLRMGKKIAPETPKTRKFLCPLKRACINEKRS